MIEMNDDRNALKFASLVERIGQLVISYEGTIAELRADATIQINNLNLKIAQLTRKLEELTVDPSVDPLY